MTQVKATQKRKKNRYLGLILILLVMFGLMGYKIYCDATYNELTNELSELNGQYGDLINEEKRLNIKLSEKADLSNVEVIATNQLGMSKIEQYQIEYVSLDTEDRAVVIDNSDSGVFTELFRNFSVILEYLS